MSPEVNELRSELRVVRDREEHDGELLLFHSDAATSAQCSAAELERLIIDCITAHNYTKALLRVKQYG